LTGIAFNRTRGQRPPRGFDLRRDARPTRVQGTGTQQVARIRHHLIVRASNVAKERRPAGALAGIERVALERSRHILGVSAIGCEPPEQLLQFVE
jgi:hypothetical protein